MSSHKYSWHAGGKSVIIQLTATMDRLLALFLSLASFPCSQGHTSLYDQYDPTKCTNSYYSEKWASTGEVPTKLAQAPPAPLYMRYNRKTVFPADIVTTENMIQRPKLKFASEPGALYTVMIIDFGIERFMGDQYFHWMVANVPNAYSINRGLGDEVSRRVVLDVTIYQAISQVNEYLPPFYFKVSPGPPPGLDQTTGTAGHDLLVLLYKQMGGKVGEMVLIMVNGNKILTGEYVR